MGQKSKVKARKEDRPSKAVPVPVKPAPLVAPTPIFAIGTILLIASVLSSGALASSRILHLSLPGCGVASPCEKLAASAWGKVPGTQWPVSYVGVAYFAALLVLWFVQRGGVGSAARNLVRLGAFGSLLFVFVMVFDREVCPYCLVAHIGNLAFAALVEFRAVSMRAALPAAMIVAVVFGATTAGLAVVESRERTRLDKEDKAAFDKSTDEMIDKSRNTPATKPTTTTEPAPAR